MGLMLFLAGSQGRARSIRDASQGAGPWPKKRQAHEREVATVVGESSVEVSAPSSPPSGGSLSPSEVVSPEDDDELLDDVVPWLSEVEPVLVALVELVPVPVSLAESVLVLVPVAEPVPVPVVPVSFVAPDVEVDVVVPVSVSVSVNSGSGQS